MYGGTIGVINIDSTYGTKLSINTAKITNSAHIQNALNMAFDCQNASFSDTGYILVYKSSIAEFNFGQNPKCNSDFRFWDDTLKKIFLVFATFPGDSGKSHTSTRNIFHFERCYIDANFFFFDEIPNSIFLFEGCTFGPNADLSDFPAHKVMFRGCKFTGTDRFVGLHSNADTNFISFINTNLDNIRFNYTAKTRLWFDTLDDPDAIESAYAHLLKKFKDDGKTNAAKIIDIQHKQLTEGKIFNYLDRVWWGYGYDKFNELNWLIFMLTFFFLINVSFPKQIGLTYPIIAFNLPQQRRYRKIHRLARIFLFTIFIFFSLRIDFEKLNYNRLGFVFLILIEYAVGVWCLFFIARTLLNF